jgi:hypothetical protein
MDFLVPVTGRIKWIKQAGLRSIQSPPVRYLGIEEGEALEIAEQTDLNSVRADRPFGEPQPAMVGRSHTEAVRRFIPGVE